MPIIIKQTPEESAVEDLLAAARDAADDIADRISEWANGEIDPEDDEVVQALRAAIAKAEGQ